MKFRHIEILMHVKRRATCCEYYKDVVKELYEVLGHRLQDFCRLMFTDRE